MLNPKQGKKAGFSLRYFLARPFTAAQAKPNADY